MRFAPALLVAAGLLLLTWLQRRDPLDLAVVLAGLLGLGWMLWTRAGTSGQRRLAGSILIALLAGVALFGVREPGSVLGFALVLAATQFVLRRLLGGR